MKKRTKAQMAQEIKSLKAQLASTSHFASKGIEHASQQDMMGSAVILELTDLGGRELILPVAIRDGLSDETIAAIKADLKRSYDLAVSLTP